MKRQKFGFIYLFLTQRPALRCLAVAAENTPLSKFREGILTFIWNAFNKEGCQHIQVYFFTTSSLCMLPVYLRDLCIDSWVFQHLAGSDWLSQVLIMGLLECCSILTSPRNNNNHKVFSTTISEALGHYTADVIIHTKQLKSNGI